MVIETPRFGRMEVPEESVIVFSEGLLGFRDFKRYFFHEPSPGSVLVWMQSVDLPALAFVVTDPRIIKSGYEVKVTPAQLEGLEVKSAADAQVWVILTIPEDPSKMTANLQGPVVVNRAKGLGAQLVLNEEGMTTKYSVLEGLRSQGRAG